MGSGGFVRDIGQISAKKWVLLFLTSKYRLGKARDLIILVRYCCNKLVNKTASPFDMVLNQETR